MQKLDKCFSKAQCKFLQVCEYVQAHAKSLIASLGALCKPIAALSKPCMQNLCVKLHTACHMVMMHTHTFVMAPRCQRGVCSQRVSDEDHIMHHYTSCTYHKTQSTCLTFSGSWALHLPQSHRCPSRHAAQGLGGSTACYGEMHLVSLHIRSSCTSYKSSLHYSAQP